MRVQAVVRALVLGVALPVVIGSGCSGDSTAVVRVTGVRFGSAPPSSVTAGTSFTVTVELLRSNGDVAEGATQEVTLILLNPGTAVLNGTTTADAVDGVATFSGLSINIAGAGRQLHASTTEFATQSAAFSVAPGAASTSESSVSPAPGNVPPNSGAALTFTFKDAFGNLVASKPVSLTTSLAGSVLTPSSGVTSASGTFVTEFSSSSTGSATLGAVVDGVPVSTAAPYVVVAGLCPVDPVPMAFPGTVNGTQPCGGYIATAFSPGLYSFTAPGGGARFTVTATYPTGVFVTPSLAQPPLFVGFSGGTNTTEWLLPAGDYVAGLVADNGGSGAFTLTTTSGPGNAGAVERILVRSGTYAGQSLAVGDRVDQIQTGEQWYADDYIFYSPGSCTLTMQSPGFSAFFAVTNTSTPGGVEVRETAPGVDAVIVLPACGSPETGPVFVYASSVVQLATGAYTLIVDAPEAGVVGASLRASRSAAHATTVPLPSFSRSALTSYRSQLRAVRGR